MKVIGIEDVNYVNRDGRQVVGTRLYISDELLLPNVGVSCKDIFISQARSSEFKLGEISGILSVPNQFGTGSRYTGVIYK